MDRHSPIDDARGGAAPAAGDASSAARDPAPPSPPAPTGATAPVAQDARPEAAPEAERAKEPGGDARPARAPAGAADTGGEAERQQQRARTRRRRLALFLVLLAILFGGGGAAYWVLVASRFESTDDAFVDGEIVRVSPQIAGTLVDVPVRENARVAPGDVLARIDPRGPDAALAVAAAQLAQARTGVGTAEARVSEAEAQVTAQASARDAAAVRAGNADRSAGRFTELAGRSGNLTISAQQVEDAVAAAQEADATLKQAEATLEQARVAVTTARAQLATARAAVAAADAAVGQAKVDVEHLTVTSQIAGQVVQVNVNRGSYVDPGTQMMAIVPDDLYVTANYKETQLDAIRAGQAVDVSVDAFPEVTFHGRVDSIQHGAGQAFALLPPQNATGNFVKVVQRVPVRIAIEGSPSFADYPIGPGMSVVPSVHIK